MAPGNEFDHTQDYLPVLSIRFPDINTMDVLSLGQFLDGLGEALTRVNELCFPEIPLQFRARIYPGSMNIELFTEKKKTRWQQFKDANKNELKVAPLKVATGLTVAGLLAAIAYLTGPHIPLTGKDQPSDTIIIGRHQVLGPSNIGDIGYSISHDR